MSPPREIRIDQRLPCLGCGYDLRSLTLARVCPECGRPAAESLDHLLLCPEGYLRRIRTGALLAGSASVSAPISLAIGLMAYGLVGLAGLRGGHDSEFMWAFVAVVVLGLGPLVGAIGWAKLRYLSPPVVLPDGRVHTPAQPAWAWTTTPLSLALLLASWTLLAMLTNEALSGTRSLGFTEEAWAMITVVLGTLWALRMAAGMRLLRDISRRAGRPREARSSAFWSIVCGCAIAAGFAGFTLDTRLVEFPLSFPGLESEDIGAMLLIASIGAAMAVSLGNFALQQALRFSAGRIMRAVRARPGPVLVLVGEDSPEAIGLQENPR